MRTLIPVSVSSCIFTILSIKIDVLERQFDRYDLKHYTLFRSKMPNLLTVHRQVSGKEKSHRELISLLYADASIRHLEI